MGVVCLVMTIDNVQFSRAPPTGVIPNLEMYKVLIVPSMGHGAPGKLCAASLRASVIENEPTAHAPFFFCFEPKFWDGKVVRSAWPKLLEEEDSDGKEGYYGEPRSRGVCPDEDEAAETTET